MRAAGRFAIAAYLNVPVYAAFHEWLGRGRRARPMWDAWKAGDRKAALAAIPDEVVDELIVHGSPRACRAHDPALLRQRRDDDPRWPSCRSTRPRPLGGHRAARPLRWVTPRRPQRLGGDPSALAGAGLLASYVGRAGRVEEGLMMRPDELVVALSAVALAAVVLPGAIAAGTAPPTIGGGGVLRLNLAWMRRLPQVRPPPDRASPAPSSASAPRSARRAPPGRLAGHAVVDARSAGGRRRSPAHSLGVKSGSESTSSGRAQRVDGTESLCLGLPAPWRRRRSTSPSSTSRRSTA